LLFNNHFLYTFSIVLFTRLKPKANPPLSGICSHIPSLPPTNCVSSGHPLFLSRSLCYTFSLLPVRLSTDAICTCSERLSRFARALVDPQSLDVAFCLICLYLNMIRSLFAVSINHFELEKIRVLKPTTLFNRLSVRRVFSMLILPIVERVSAALPVRPIGIYRI
jgi:hypothetical protein